MYFNLDYSIEFNWMFCVSGHFISIFGKWSDSIKFQTFRKTIFLLSLYIVQLNYLNYFYSSISLSSSFESIIIPVLLLNVRFCSPLNKALWLFFRWEILQIRGNFANLWRNEHGKRYWNFCRLYGGFQDLRQGRTGFDLFSRNQKCT